MRTALEGHHIEGARNVLRGSTSHDGRDIFHAAVQMSRMPMCLTDPHAPDNPLIFCNRAFEQLTGYPQEEILGRNCRFLQGEQTDPATVASIRADLEASRDVHTEILNYRKDGHAFWSALFISPVVDPEGKLLYFFASQIDVTTRREAEAVLQQSQRMETLGSMAASLAHEYNNLMTIVLAALERLGVARDEAARAKQVERAEWGARRAARLTDQMLSFTRRQFHDRQTADLNTLVTNIDGILDQMAGSSCTVVVRPAPGPLPVSIDAGQMEMALLNLVRNASDAMPEGGDIEVATHATEGEASVAVIDRGEGMPPEVARRATEPFFTTKPSGRGTGLGLSMVKGFAEQSGGRLEIESAPKRGTTIRIVVPLKKS